MFISKHVCVRQTVRFSLSVYGQSQTCFYSCLTNKSTCSSRRLCSLFTRWRRPCRIKVKVTLCVVGVDAGNAVTPSTGTPTADGVLYILTGAMERYRLWVVENRPSPLLWPLAYTTACTTVQAVMLQTSMEV